ADLAFGQYQAGALLDPGHRLSQINRGPGQLAGPKLQQLLGNAALRPVEARKTQRLSPTVSAVTAPSANSRSRGARINSCGTSRSFSASGTRSSVGKPQWPSSIASVSA